MTVAATFAEFSCALAHERIPPDALHAATRCLVDWWGGTLAGSVVPPATLLRTALRPAGGPSRLLPDGTRTDPRTAALLNGTAAHAVEVDDIYSPGQYHPAAPVIAAALAVADLEGTSGAEFLAGIVAGYEVSNRIARAIVPAHYRWWHTTGTVGFFGAAAAAARILRLDAGPTAHALTTVATLAAGLRHAFSGDAMSKPLHAGRAAEGGVLAALGARAGLTGVPDMLEGERGFGRAMAENVDWSAATAGLGTEWTITRMTHKPHPCCGHAFAAIDAAQEIVRGGVAANDIAAIRVGTYQTALEVCGNADPSTPYEAKFSLPCTVALAALGRPIDLDAFAPAALRDPALRAMMARVELAVDAEAEAAFPSLRGAVVTITEGDGFEHRFRQKTRRGDPDHPVSDAGLGAKFQMLAVPVIGAEAAERLASALWSTQRLPSVAGIRARQAGAAR